MSWIEVIEESSASPELRQLYEQVRDPRSGRLDNIMSVHSLHPQGLAAHYILYRTVMSGTGSLRKVDRELIALVVSLLNACHY
jgi:alkylhydroperoxidase family enzyme